ncbi:MAG: protein-glutamate O-methyltransferase [Candidatus Rifleibacteriota bacterium]
MFLTDKEFNEIRDMVYSRFGISLGEHKKALVFGRLRKFAIQKGFRTFSELVDYVKNDNTGSSMQELIDRISTNHTFFFREQQHFDFFKHKILPELAEKLKEQRSSDIRIWCAAASTGEEPYSIMMTMLDYFGNSYVNYIAGLLATDISSKAIETAQRGVYSTEQVGNIPEKMLKKYLHRIDEESWGINSNIKKEITFRRFNLMNEVFPFKKQFHVIFCRNVMIYFDMPTRNKLVKKLYAVTAPGGYLFVGHSESIRTPDCPYEYVQPAVFRKREF